jgi:hypothetical protein
LSGLRKPQLERGVYSCVHVCTYTYTYTHKQRDTIQGTVPHCPDYARWRTSPPKTAFKYSIRPRTHPRKPTTESRMQSAQFHTVTCRPISTCRGKKKALKTIIREIRICLSRGILDRFCHHRNIHFPSR